MDKRVYTKKGFTLAEICVVFAVVSIVAVMVVFFSSYLSKRVKQNDQTVSILYDVNGAESFVEDWVNEFRSNGATFSVENNSTIIATLNGEKYTLSYIDKSLVAQFMDRTDSFKLNQFNSFNVKISTSSQNKIIFICTLTAPIHNTNNVTVYPCTFTVYTMVGNTGEVA